MLFVTMQQREKCQLDKEYNKHSGLICSHLQAFISHAVVEAR